MALRRAYPDVLFQDMSSREMKPTFYLRPCDNGVNAVSHTSDASHPTQSRHNREDINFAIGPAAEPARWVGEDEAVDVTLQDRMALK